jgi:indolepyruvate ferredoxin oxidoreductase
VDALVAKRVAFLTDYQSAAYANSYRAVVERVRVAETALNKTTLTEAVARNLFKLMAYKDEYEVARLHTDIAFLQKIDGMFEGNFTLNYHLAPPLIAKTSAKGELQKQKFGPLMLTGFKVLKHFKWLRGSVLDVFGYAQERRTERALIVQYQSSVAAMLGQLNASNHALAVEMARIPEQIKGFGHVKARHLAAARLKWDALKVQWSALS